MAENDTLRESLPIPVVGNDRAEDLRMSQAEEILERLATELNIRSEPDHVIRDKRQRARRDTLVGA